METTKTKTKERDKTTEKNNPLKIPNVSPAILPNPKA